LSRIGTFALEQSNCFLVGLKIFAGRLGDRARAKRPLVLIGYTVSSLVRPLVAVAQTWTHVFAVRVVDRVGKGVRGAPRDAILAACATPETRGRIFGFHRAMDHVGAIIGPLLASLFLLVAPGNYRLLFALTIVPGAAAVWMLTRVPETRIPRGKDPGHPSSAGARPPAAADSLSWRNLPRDYYALLAVLLVFTLGNSADAFLLLRLADAGIAPALIPLLWALLHVVKAGMSVWGGVKSDRWGRRGVIGAGWLLYAVVYAGFAASQSAAALVGWFLLYGLYFGLCEGAERALIADLTPASMSGTAFGLYNAALGVGALLASVGFGLVWKLASPAAAFALGACLALLAAVLLFVLVREPRRG